ncbi:hypothetical protein BGZ76_003966 [Entomortierella beljakovae]|nr:hypothetical protein BGZ76_003966 [Entomortierella beljakovae]
MENILENPALFNIYSYISAQAAKKYFDHPEFASSDTTYTSVPPGTKKSKDQYQHYIPHFILKTFSDGLKMEKGGPLINMYDVRTEELTLEFSRRSYGIQNMYIDVTAEDCMELEKLLSKFESSSATFIQKILSDTKEIFLTRVQLSAFKKFLVIMTYRDASRRRQYMLDNFDQPTRESIQRHMLHNKIGTIKEVWFENLKWVIKNSAETILNEHFSHIRSTMFKNLGILDVVRAYKGPIHISELEEFANLLKCYLCIWQAPEGSEFIITDNCFGCFEGHGPITFHHFYVVSPKYAVVMVNRSDMDRVNIGPLSIPLRKSWFEEFHLFPGCDYMNNNGIEGASPDDVFRYQRIVIPKKKVYLVNSIFLDSRHKSISYKSKGSLYRTLKYYDEVKETMFHHRYDYSDLKKKLFVEMNRTHST